MHNFFVQRNQLNSDIKILGNDVNHIKNVLRLKVGNELCVHIRNSNDKYLCKITKIGEDNVICSIIEKLEGNNESNIYINIIQALPKNDKMEFIIQKCTELGVNEFTPLNLNRCIVKLIGKDEQKKIARWQTIAEVAAKQCGRDIVPIVNSVHSLSDLKELLKDYDQIIVAYENEEKMTFKNVINQGVNKIAVIVGPEGGIEEKEALIMKNMGFNTVSLGNRILRTETVAIALTSIIQYILGNLG